MTSPKGVPQLPAAKPDLDAVESLGLAAVRLGPGAAGRCRRRIHLDAADRETRVGPSAATSRAFDELAEHRDRIFAVIRAANAELVPASSPAVVGPAVASLRAARPEALGPPAVEVPAVGHSAVDHCAVGQPADVDIPAVEPAGWLIERPRLVLSPSMATATRSGGADLLVWVGDGYAPVIIRGHRTRENGSGIRFSALSDPLVVRCDPTFRARRNRADRLALAHHYRQLTELGCASATARGGVIGRGSFTDGAGRADLIGNEDDGAIIVWHELAVPGSSVLDDYDRRFDDRLAVARAAAADGPALARPSRIVDCRRCPWWPRCSAELIAAADISLLLTGDDVAVARASNIPTITALADLPKAALATLPLTVTPSRQAQIRARAWVRGVPLVQIRAGAAIRRADVELDVDAESYGEDGAYLWGAALSGADVGLPQGYRAFVTWQRLPSTEQGAIFGDFFGYLMSVRAAAVRNGLSFGVFCYAKSAEERWMLGLARRYAGLPGMPGAREVAAFCASSEWIDVLQEIKRQFIPRGSLRLKELAGAMGFHWRDPEPGGENSMAWYRAAVDEPTSALGVEMAQRVLRYNEDDVLATLSVRRWVNEHHAELPTVAELGGPI